MIKCIDLFSGCGGFSRGFQNAGISIEASIDNWDKAVDVYQENFEHKCHLYDLSDEEGAIQIINDYLPDMIIGGPPCQDFSSAGKRDETLGRANLTYSFAKIICAYKPKIFVMENVERIKKSHIMRDITEQLEESGYGLSSVILNAAYCNTPQSRNRFFLIGILGESHNVLVPTLRKNLNNKPMTIRDYLGDSLGLEYYYRHPRNYSRRGIFSIDEPSPTVRGVNRPLPSGYKKNSADPDGVDFSNIRPLTTIERSYLQTFPKDYQFFGSKTSLEQMIGNAVSVNLAEFVAKSILEFLEKSCTPNIKQVGMFSNKQPFILAEKALHLI